MKFSRRHFLGAAAGLTVGALASPAPWRAWDDLAWLRRHPSDLPSVPRGPVETLATVSGLCPGAPGVVVLAADGRPFAVRPNPAHPLGRGGLGPLALSEVQALYGPDRLRRPLLRNASGSLVPVSWSKALAVLAQALRDAGPDVAVLDGGGDPTVRELFGVLLAGRGSEALYAMPTEERVASAALALLGGEGRPGYDFDNADLIVALGADVRESLPAASALESALARNGAPLVAVGPVRPAGGAEWIPMRAGSEAWAALGLAWHLLEAADQPGGRALAGACAADFSSYRDLVRARFSPQAVAYETGTSREALAGLARRLVTSKRPVVIPTAPGGQGASLAALVSGLGLNVLLGRVNRPGGLYQTVRTPELFSDVPRTGDAAAWAKAVAQGQARAPKALLVHEADPLAELPGCGLLGRAVGKAGFSVFLGAHPNKTSAACHLALPELLPLERFGQADSPYGLAWNCQGLVHPLVSPWTDAKNAGDVVIELSGLLDAPLRYTSMRQALHARCLRLETRPGFVVRDRQPCEVLAGAVRPASGAGVWNALIAGLAWADTTSHAAPLSLGAGFLSRRAVAGVRDPGAPLALVPQSPPGAGTVAGGPLLCLGQALDAYFSSGLPVARLNSTTAESLAVNPGDKARLRGPFGQCLAVVALDDTVAPGHVVLVRGPGRASAINALFAPADAGEGGLFWAGSSVSLEKI